LVKNQLLVLANGEEYKIKMKLSTQKFGQGGRGEKGGYQKAESRRQLAVGKKMKD